jgi:hypothetical protein
MNGDLAQGLKNHLEEINKQIERLDRMFKKRASITRSEFVRTLKGSASLN